LNGNESVHFYIIDCFFPLLPTRPLPDLTMSNYGVCLIITGLADPFPAFMHSTLQLQLEKTEWAIKNGQSKDIVNIGQMT
jgi:hypothetical protein